MIHVCSLVLLGFVLMLRVTKQNSMYSWDNIVQVYDVSDANNHTDMLHAVDGESDTALLYTTGKENIAAGIMMLSNPYATIEESSP